ncbi:MAG: TolC family protein [Deltaproteobacteria bacterium]|nr:TolC family protein [Deltaproteobacteria bacterium]
MRNKFIVFLFAVVYMSSGTAHAQTIKNTEKPSGNIKKSDKSGDEKSSGSDSLSTRETGHEKSVIKKVSEPEVVSRKYETFKTIKSAVVKTLSLRESLKKSMINNPEIKIEDLKISESRLRLKGEKRNILPKLKLEATFLRWDSPLKFDLGTSSDIAPPEDCPIGCLTFLSGMFSNMGNLRELYTQSYKVTVAQPITGAFALLNVIKARKVDVDVKEIEKELKELSIKFKTVNAYIQVLQAEEYRDISLKSEKLLKAHLARAQKFYKSGLLAKSEILRLNTALGKAIHQRIESEAGVTITMDLLKMQMGESNSVTYRLTEKLSRPSGLLNLSLDQAYRIMEKNRKEIASLNKKKEMLKLSYKASSTMLLPSANVILQYEHNEGLGTLQPANSWFVGLNVSFQWEWNKKHIETDVIQAQMLQLEAAKRQITLALRLNVKTKLSQLRTSWNKISIAETALSEAKEALRLEQLQFTVKTKTAISLLDAQTRYDGARVNLINSIYEYYKNLAGLMYAMGTGSVRGSMIKW